MELNIKDISKNQKDHMGNKKNSLYSALLLAMGTYVTSDSSWADSASVSVGSCDGRRMMTRRGLWCSAGILTSVSCN